MYKCEECERIFEEPGIYREDCTPGGVFEGGSFIQEYNVCPYCDSSNYWEIEECCKCEFHGIVEKGEYTSEGFVCEDCLVEEEENGESIL